MKHLKCNSKLRTHFLKNETSGFYIVLIFLVGFLMAGCSSTGTYLASNPSRLNRNLMNDVKLWEHSLSEYDDEVRVTVAVPTQEETIELFGADLTAEEIQPIWIKVDNHGRQALYLIRSSIDPNYFSPIEACSTVHSGWCEEDQYFRSMNFQNPIMPNTSVSGFIFSNLDQGEKIVRVDLIKSRQIKNFTFFVQVPGIRVDYRLVDFDALYSKDEIVNLDWDELRVALENLPCCTTDESGEKFGDPMNLIMIGDFKDIAAAFVRRGWFPAEETYSTAVWKTIKSFFFGSRYRYSPLSSLYFYGRHQDFARQKPRSSVHERNHLRLWYSNMRYRGKPVFVGQISRDIGVRLTSEAWPPVTHKIDPDVDQARNALVEDLLFSQMVAKVGFVKGVGESTSFGPRRNLTGDPYFTDGLRVVIFIEPGPIALTEFESLDWEHPGKIRMDSESAH